MEKAQGFPGIQVVLTGDHFGVSSLARSFSLMKKKQKIKEGPLVYIQADSAPVTFPAYTPVIERRVEYYFIF